MRLTQIKLAGFKSFIDPTTIHVPSQLVAVIGPNGCGKSNVIDAVRWVLGESSAKQLRGESMQDVISNGAATRRPAPRASVELVFDNSDHVIQGAWGQYAEIAIKRQLTRQGDSSYFINNQAVRRRDITDLFLGTGVGAKGYAVIEQGMISRIIEARPEELRVYIEEAAGISKYKERRRETATRLDDTRDHLQRLADLQTELARQVEKLHAQAATAEQYRSLKAELAQNQNLSDYIQWQNALANAEAAQAQHADAQAQQESHQANSDSLNQRIQELRLTEREQQQQHDALQQQHAQSREHAARLEEQIRAQHAQNERAERDRQSAQAQLHKLQQQHADTLAEREALLQQAQEKNSELAELALIVAEHEARLPELETAEQTSQHNHQSQRDQIGSLKRELALKQQQQQHTQTTLANHRSRIQPRRRTRPACRRRQPRLATSQRCRANPATPMPSRRNPMAAQSNAIRQPENTTAKSPSALPNPQSTTHRRASPAASPCPNPAQQRAQRFLGDHRLRANPKPVATAHRPRSLATRHQHRVSRALARQKAAHHQQSAQPLAARRSRMAQPSPAC